MEYQNQVLLLQKKGFVKVSDLYKDKNTNPLGDFKCKDKEAFCIYVKNVYGPRLISIEHYNGNYYIYLASNRGKVTCLKGMFKNYVAAATYYERVLSKDHPPLFGRKA